MKRLLLSLWTYRLVRWTFAAIFLVASGSKLVDPSGFALLITDYGLVPESWSLPVAVALPALEVAAAAALLADLRGSLSTVTVLMVLFIAILSYGIWMGLDVDCGCFGPNDPEAEVYHSLRPALYRDLLLMLGLAYLYAWRRMTGMRPRPWPFPGGKTEAAPSAADSASA